MMHFDWNKQLGMKVKKDPGLWSSTKTIKPSPPFTYGKHPEKAFQIQRKKFSFPFPSLILTTGGLIYRHQKSPANKQTKAVTGDSPGWKAIKPIKIIYAGIFTFLTFTTSLSELLSPYKKLEWIRITNQEAYLNFGCPEFFVKFYYIVMID